MCHVSRLGVLSSALDAGTSASQMSYIAIDEISQAGWTHWQIQHLFLQDINLTKLIMTPLRCDSPSLDIRAPGGLLVMIHIEGAENVVMTTTSDLEEVVVAKVDYSGAPSILKPILTCLRPLQSSVYTSNFGNHWLIIKPVPPCSSDQLLVLIYRMPGSDSLLLMSILFPGAL